MQYCYKKQQLRNETYAKSSTCDIIRIEHPISYCEFFNKYLLPNRVCLLGSWATKDWPCRKDWVNRSRRPNIEFLKQNFGSATECPVADCSTHEYDTHCKIELNFEQYLCYLEAKRDDMSKEERCLYLKDWHFTKIFPDYEAYTTPDYFQSDWLNEFLDVEGWEPEKNNNDYRFVYMGPKGSWTPFHSDVLRSHSWSANICGSKLWIFYLPGNENQLKDRFGQLPFDLKAEDFQKDHASETCRLEVIQREGEVLFVPAGWHHQVINLEETISINHNWINGSNIDLTWQYLCDVLCETKREISDCIGMDGWEKQCQRILKAAAGVDFQGFYKFVLFIARKRLDDLAEINIPDLALCTCDTSATTEEVTLLPQSDTKPCPETVNCNSCNFSPRSSSHKAFDLAQICEVLSAMTVNEYFSCLVDEFEDDVQSPMNLLEEIKTKLNVN